LESNELINYIISHIIPNIGGRGRRGLIIFGRRGLIRIEIMIAIIISKTQEHLMGINEKHTHTHHMGGAKRRPARRRRADVVCVRFFY